MLRKPARSLLVTLGCIILCIVPVHSQTIQIGGGLGVMVPTSDFGGTTLDYYNGQRFGFSTGFSMAGKFRSGYDGFHLVGILGFASVTNHGTSEPGKGSVEITQNILTLAAGPEYQFVSAPVSPYLGATIALNHFSGKTQFQGAAKVPSATFDVEGSSRFGIGFHGGILFKVASAISLDLGLGYNLMNIGGKSWVDVNPMQDQRLDSYLALNDGADPLFKTGDDKHIVGNTRSISSFQVMVSVMFGL